jgi:hypothetical protein
MSASTQRLSRLEIVVIASQGSSLSNGVGRGVKAWSLKIQSERAEHAASLPPSSLLQRARSRGLEGAYHFGAKRETVEWLRFDVESVGLGYFVSGYCKITYFLTPKSSN